MKSTFLTILLSFLISLHCSAVENGDKLCWSFSASGGSVGTTLTYSSSTGWSNFTYQIVDGSLYNNHGYVQSGTAVNCETLQPIAIPSENDATGSETETGSGSGTGSDTGTGSDGCNCEVTVNAYQTVNNSNGGDATAITTEQSSDGTNIYQTINIENNFDEIKSVLDLIHGEMTQTAPSAEPATNPNAPSSSFSGISPYVTTKNDDTDIVEISPNKITAPTLPSIQSRSAPRIPIDNYEIDFASSFNSVGAEQGVDFNAILTYSLCFGIVMHFWFKTTILFAQ